MSYKDVPENKHFFLPFLALLEYNPIMAKPLDLNVSTPDLVASVEEYLVSKGHTKISATERWEEDGVFHVFSEQLATAFKSAGAYLEVGGNDLDNDGEPAVSIIADVPDLENPLGSKDDAGNPRFTDFTREIKSWEELEEILARFQLGTFSFLFWPFRSITLSWPKPLTAPKRTPCQKAPHAMKRSFDERNFRSAMLRHGALSATTSKSRRRVVFNAINVSQIMAVASMTILTMNIWKVSSMSKW